MIAAFDATLSSLLTCHPVPANPSKGAEAQQHKENCTALAGPVLITLEAIVDFFEGHGEAVTAVFTIVLAAFTGTLWWSTNKLWTATREADKARARETEILQRAYISVEPAGISASDDPPDATETFWSRIWGTFRQGMCVGLSSRSLVSITAAKGSHSTLASLKVRSPFIPGTEMQQGGPII